jgi:hypothetical protein
MSNRLKMSKSQFIIALREKGWSLTRIAEELGVHRHTVARYVDQQAQSAPAPDPDGPKSTQLHSGSDAPKSTKAPPGSADSKSTKAPTGWRQGTWCIRLRRSGKDGIIVMEIDPSLSTCRFWSAARCRFSSAARQRCQHGP